MKRFLSRRNLVSFFSRMTLGVLCFTPIISNAETVNFDSLKTELYKLNGNYEKVNFVRYFFSTYNDFNEMIAVSNQFSKELIHFNDYLYIKNEIAKSSVYNSQGKQVEATMVLSNLITKSYLKKSPKLIGSICNSMGNIYFSGNNYEKARSFYMKYKHYVEEANDSVGLKASIINIGNTFYHVNNYDSARYYFEKAQLLEDANIMAFRSNLLNNMALVYTQFNEHDKALKNYEILIAENNDNPKNQIVHLLNYAKVLQHFNRSEEALEALDLAKKISKTSNEMGFYPSLIEAEAFQYNAIGNYKLAYSKMRTADSLKLIDIGNKPDKAIEMLIADHKKELVENENKAHKLELSNTREKHTRQRIFLIVLSFASIFIIALLYRSRLLLKKIHHKNNELKVLNETLDAFNLHVSHDLKTIMNNTISLSQMIKKYNEKTDTQKVNNITDRLVTTSLEGKEKIMSFLELGKTTRHKTSHAFEPENMLDELLNNNGLEDKIKLDLTGSKQIIIPFSKTEFNSIFLNFITNTIKYNENDPEAQIHFNMTKSSLKIKYADNGIGIDLNENKDKLFAPFVRIKNNSTADGTGIGLFMVRKIILQSGGTIEAKSTPGNGLTFEINFPMKTRKLF